MLILMYFGTLMFFNDETLYPLGPFNLYEEEEKSNASRRDKNNTTIFHTFFLMNWFNILNCRLINNSDINPFKDFCSNWIMWAVMAIEMALQTLLLWFGAEGSIGNTIFGTSEMDWTMHLTAWCFGSFVLAWNVIIKKIPADKFAFFLKLNLEGDENSKSKMESLIDGATERLSTARNSMKQNSDGVE
jgi:magnesium-transporting ATPase (P-type)